MRLSSHRPTRSPSPSDGERRSRGPSRTPVISSSGQAAATLAPGASHGSAMAEASPGEGRPEKACGRWYLAAFPRHPRDHPTDVNRAARRAGGAVKRQLAYRVDHGRPYVPRRAGVAPRRRRGPRPRPAAARRTPRATARTRRRRTAAQRAPSCWSAAPSARSGWGSRTASAGWSAAVGRQAATAHELDPEHRRDGAGLLLLGARDPDRRRGLVLRAPARSAAGRQDGTRLFFGAIAVALPLLLLVRRDPADAPAGDEPEHRGRGLVGWTALLVATAGLLHLGTGQPADRPPSATSAGGAARRAASAPALRARPSRS